MSKFAHQEAKAVYDRLSNSNIKPRVTKAWLEEEKFDSKMSAMYGTKELAKLITDPDSKYYADYRLSWCYGRYDLDIWELYNLCYWVDPSFGVPQDYRLGANDYIYPIDAKIKDATMKNNEMYKPSVEHIVPTSMGGPRSDIRNIMILPLSINKALHNMNPQDRQAMIYGLSSKNFQKRVEKAERLFY
ncbi:hypothetical protein OAG45_00120 [bacterium]|nr:hypothetical protein [bacterium]